MKKILRFLRDSWLTLFCVALLLGATATAWRLLDAPLDPYIYAEYAVAKSAPEYKDIIFVRTLLTGSPMTIPCRRIFQRMHPPSVSPGASRSRRAS